MVDRRGEQEQFSVLQIQQCMKKVVILCELLDEIGVSFDFNPPQSVHTDASQSMLIEFDPVSVNQFWQQYYIKLFESVVILYGLLVQADASQSMLIEFDPVTGNQFWQQYYIKLFESG
eukprot:Gb_11669 [translate_table: standard]